MNFFMMNLRIHPGVQYESQSSLAENAILKNVGLGATADPVGSCSIWRMCQSPQRPVFSDYQIPSVHTHITQYFYFNVL